MAKFKLDNTEFNILLSELEFLISSANSISKRTLKSLKGFFESPDKLFTLKSESTVSRTGEITVFFQPSESFLKFMVTLRASNG